MSVTTTHPQYDAYVTSWAALEDAYQGEAAVKGARSSRQRGRGTPLNGTRYLPRPPGMLVDEQYIQYRDKASWSDFTAVAVNSITGAIFRKEPVVEVPDALLPQLTDVTQTGVPLRTFAQQTTRETLKMGRYGILIDYPPPPETEVPTLASILQREPIAPVLEPPPRPYWIPYATQEIRNWRKIQIQGTTLLSLVVLEEHVGIPQGPWPTPDFFVVQDVTQYRVLRLNEHGQYEVSLWVELPTARGQRPMLPQHLSTWIPLRMGEPLPFIPFIPLGPYSLDIDVQKSLLEGFVEVNYRHYRHSADYERALFLTASPTGYVCSDLEKPAEELLVGASVLLWIQNANSKVGFLQLDPAGIPGLQIAMETDKKDMAALGARLLERPADLVETRIAANARTQGAESPMQSLVTTVSQGLTQALQIHAWWAGLTENWDDPAIRMALNADLVAADMDPQMLTALMQALLNNTISYETFFYNLQKGEVARPMSDAEEEQALIEIRQQQQPLIAPTAPALPSSRNGNARPVASGG